MSMFDNYTNLNPSYVPNNVQLKPDTYKSIPDEFPEKLCNIKGECFGYKWHHGDSIRLNIKVDNEYKVESDAIILTQKNAVPETTQQGYKGQKCYNTHDALSWTCTSIGQTVYTWVKDTDLQIPDNGEKSVVFYRQDTSDSDSLDVTLDIYNFNHIWIYQQPPENNGRNITFVTTESLYKIMVPGIYFIKITASDGTDTLVVKEFQVVINQ